MDSLILAWDRLMKASFWFIMAAIALIILILNIVSSIQEGDRDEAAHYACALAGYPQVIEIDDHYFCHKLVDGTDFVRSLEELE